MAAKKKPVKDEPMTFDHVADARVRKLLEANEVPAKPVLKRLVTRIAKALADDENNPDVSYDALDWREARVQAASAALEAGELAACYREVRLFWKF